MIKTKQCLFLQGGGGGVGGSAKDQIRALCILSKHSLTASPTLKQCILERTLAKLLHFLSISSPQQTCEEDSVMAPTFQMRKLGCRDVRKQQIKNRERVSSASLSSTVPHCLPLVTMLGWPS
jgi:hypothetical protein